MDRFHGLKIGMQAWTLRNFEIEDVVSKTAELGLEHLELGALGRSGLGPESPDKVAVAAALCRARGVHTEVYNAKFPSDLSEEAQQPNFDLARQLGARCVSGGIAIELLPVLDRLAAEYDMTVAIHNHGPGGSLSGIEAIGAILKPFSPRVGLCVDTGHYLRLPLDPISVIDAFYDRVHAIHLRDMDPDKDPVKGDGGNYKEYIVGEGPLNLKGLLHRLVERRFQGVIALEYKPNPDNPMIDLWRALGHIEVSLE